MFEEPCAEEVDFGHEQELLAQYASKEDICDMTSGRQSASGKRGKSAGKSSESYERGAAKHGDQTFHKFLKRLARCPQQVLR